MLEINASHGRIISRKAYYILPDKAFINLLTDPIQMIFFRNGYTVIEMTDSIVRISPL